MTEQWKELKETIIEMRDNDGTGTQQEACKFLVSLMDVLEKQMQEPKTDRLYRWLNDMRLGIAPDETTPKDERAERLAQIDVIDGIMEWLEKNEQEQKTGHWSHDGGHWVNRWICSECGYKLFDERTMFCPNCGCRMMETEGKE